MSLFTVMGFLAPGYILFRNIWNPSWIPPEQANSYLDPDENVIGVSINNDVRAISVDDILRPHIVHETIGGQPVTLSFCMLSNSAMAYKHEFKEKDLHMIIPMQYENNMFLLDDNGGMLIWLLILLKTIRMGFVLRTGIQVLAGIC